MLPISAVLRVTISQNTLYAIVLPISAVLTVTISQHPVCYNVTYISCSYSNNFTKHPVRYSFTYISCSYSNNFTKHTVCYSVTYISCSYSNFTTPCMLYCYLYQLFLQVTISQNTLYAILLPISAVLTVIISQHPVCYNVTYISCSYSKNFTTLCIL